MDKFNTIESIYKLYMQDVYFYLLSLSRKKEVAEDLLQDTFYKAYIHLETFRNGNFKPWLFKIAYHTYIDWYRRERHVAIVPQEQIDGYINEQHQSAEDEYLFHYQMDLWLQWTEQLNWQQRHSLILRDLHDFSYAEIAEQLHMSLSAVKVAIYRGRKYIKQRLEAEKDELSRGS